MRQTALGFKTAPSTNDENKRPAEAEASKRKRAAEEQGVGALHPQAKPAPAAVAGPSEGSGAGAHQAVPADSSEDEAFEASTKPAKTAAELRAAPADSSDEDQTFETSTKPETAAELRTAPADSSDEDQAFEASKKSETAAELRAAPADSSDEDEALEVSKKVAKTTAEPRAASGPSEDDAWGAFGPPPQRAPDPWGRQPTVPQQVAQATPTRTPTGGGAKAVRGASSGKAAATSSIKKVASSGKKAATSSSKKGASPGKKAATSSAKKASTGKVKKSPKRAPVRTVPLRALPPTTQLSAELQGEAAAALVSSWQFVRCFAHVLEAPEGFLPPSLEQLDQCLCSTGELGVVSQLHVCLLKFILKKDSAALLDNETDDDEPAAAPAAPAAEEKPAGGGGRGKRGRPRGNGGVGGRSRRAQQVPRPNTGMHAWSARDLGAYVDEDTWPEVLRQLIVQWHLRVDEEDGPASRGAELAEPEPLLLGLAKRLREEEYAAVEAPLRCLALGHLCERALELLGSEISGAWEALEAARKAESNKDKAAKKVEREAQKGAKEALAEARRLSSEKWSAYCVAEEELDRASQAYHKCAITQVGVGEARAEMASAQQGRDAARESSRLAKEAVKLLQAGGGGAVDKGEESEAEEARKPTERLLSKQEARELAEVERKEAERTAAAAQLTMNRERWQEMVRLPPLGSDVNGALYWHLPRPPPPDNLEHCQPSSAPMVLVEHKEGGAWGRVSSVGALQEALAARALPQEATLRSRLADVASDEHDMDARASLRTPGGAASATPGGAAAHEWIGQRVRRVLKGVVYDGVVSGWRPARGDGKPAEWYLLYDDGDEEVIRQAEVEAALAEAAEAPLRALRRRVVELETALLGEVKKPKKAKGGKKGAVPCEDEAAGSERAQWLKRAEAAGGVAELRSLLLELEAAASSLIKEADKMDDKEEAPKGKEEAEWRGALEREREHDWPKRLRASVTTAQLSLRAAEAEWNLGAQGGVAAGAEVEVRADGPKDEGSAWRAARVVAVFGDGGFRVVWEESNGRYRTKDLAAVATRAGQHEHGKAWRFKALRVRRPTPTQQAPRQPAQQVAAGRAQRGRGRGGGPSARPQRSSAPPRGGSLREVESDSEESESEGSEASVASGSEDERAVEVGDVVQAVYNASGHTRTWLLARVTRTSRGGFEAALTERQYRREDRLQLTVRGEGKLWRWPDEDD